MNHHWLFVGLVLGFMLGAIFVRVADIDRAPRPCVCAPLGETVRLSPADEAAARKAAEVSP